MRSDLRRAPALPRQASFVLLGFLASCGGGGGGGGGGPTSPPLTDLGLVSSTTATVTTVVVENPFAKPATVSLVGATGPYGAPGLPAPVAADGSAVVSVVVDPQGTTGALAGSLTLRVATLVGSGAVQAQDVTRLFAAVGEPVDANVLPASIAFGEVPVGERKDRTVVVTNHSTKSPATVSPATVAGAGYGIVTPMPIVVAPGATADVVLRYEPTSPGAPTGAATLVTEDPDGPLHVALTATAGGEETTDLGTMTFDAQGLTSTATFTVPTDAISFLVEARCDPGTTIGLGRLEAPGGLEFENETATGTYQQLPSDEQLSAQVPNTDRPGLQVIPGTWKVRLRRFGFGDADATCRVIVERRPGGTGALGVLDLNIFFANAITPKASTAATDTNLQDILGRVGDIYATQGIRLGAIDYYDVPDATYDDVTDAEFPGLLKNSSVASKRRLDYFYVRTAIGGGVLGVAATLGGPTTQGTGLSGVMGLWIENPTASQRDLVARVMAHEMGHFLGLYHTVEQSGSHDFIDDTFECPASDCSESNHKYLMHWQANLGNNVVSNGQGLVLRGHPFVGATVPAGAPAIRRLPREEATFLALPENWCGTCTPARKPEGR